MPLTPRARAVAALLVLLAAHPGRPAHAQPTEDPGPARSAVTEADALRAKLVDPRQWRGLLATDGRKLRSGLHPGIDVVLSGNRNQVTVHLVVHPAADLAAIAFDLAGLDQLNLEKQVTALDPARRELIRLVPPRAFQMAAGVRDTIEAHYVLRDDGRIGLALGDHAPGLPVVITLAAGYTPAPAARANAAAAPEGPGVGLAATLTDEVVPDADNDGNATPGETIRYTAEIENTGVLDATDVDFDDTIDPNTTLTSGTVKTTPIAYPQEQTILEDQPLTVGMTGIDADGGSLTFSIDTPPTKGALGAITPTGPASADVTYTPTLDENGSDSFVFKVVDPDANQDLATVSITITPVNDAPTFACGPGQTHATSDGPVISVPGWATGVAAGPANEAGQTLTFNVTANTNPGLFTVLPAVDPATGDLDYTLAGTTGSADVTLELQDNGGTANSGSDTSTPCTFKISVNGPPTAVNDDPAAASAPGDAFHTALNTTLDSGADPTTPSVLANDDLGFPAGTLVSFGGGDLGGAVTDNAAGATVNIGAGSLTVNADGEFVFTPDNGFIGLFTFQYRLSNDAGSSDATVTLAVGVRPQADADGVNATGNVRMDAAAIPFSVLTNDAGDGIAVTAMDATSANGGAVVDGGGGAFSYNPPPGFEGSDTFGYTLTNGFGNTPGIVTVTVSGMIWFIDNTAPAGDGRLTSPFNSLAAFQAVNDGVGTHPAAGDNVFIRTGSGDYTGGLTLLDNQKLIGDGSSSDLATITGITPAPGSDALPTFGGADPVIVNAAGNAITLASGNTVRGLTAGATPAGFGIAGGAVGTFNVLEASVTGAGGALGISTSGTAGTAQFDELSSSAAPAAAILLTGVSGTITASSGSISDPTGTAVAVSGGSPTLTYPGTITKNTAGRVVDIDGTTGGALAFNGAIVQNVTTATGIRVANTSGTAAVTFAQVDLGSSVNRLVADAVTLSNNTGSGLVTFSNLDVFTGGARGFVSSGDGNVAVTTGTLDANGSFAGAALEVSNNQFNATFTSLVVSNGAGRGIRLQNNTGAVSVTGAANTIATTGGEGVEIVSSGIGASGITLRSVSTSAAARGIRLENTGAVVGSFFTVAGTGTTDGSGGTITGSSTQGITLSNTAAVTLKNLNVGGTVANTSAVGATSVNGLTFDNCEVTAAAGAGGGTSHALLGSALTGLIAVNSIFDGGGGAVAGAHGVKLTGLLGASSFSGTTFRNGKDTNVRIENGTTIGAPDVLDIVNGTTFTGSAGGDHLQVEANATADLKVNVNSGGGVGVVFSGTSQDGMQFLSQGAAQLETNVTQATITGNLGSAVNLTTSGSGALDAKVENLAGLSSGATNVLNMISFDTSTLDAEILNNTISLAAGSFTGIRAIQEGNGSVTASISGNTITGPGNEYGIRGQARAGTGSLNLTVLNNNVTLSGNVLALEGIAIESGSSGGGDLNAICLNMANNTSSSATAGQEGYRLRVRPGTTFQLQNFVGVGTSTADVTNWVNSTKTNTGTVQASIDVGATFSASAGNCATP